MARRKRDRRYNVHIRRETIENDYFWALRQGPVNAVRLTRGNMVYIVGLSDCYDVLDVIQAAGFDFSDRAFDYRFIWIGKDGFSFPSLLKVTYRQTKNRLVWLGESSLDGRLYEMEEGLNYE